MRALITGDRGFLGRHFSAELLRRGYDVTGLDTKASPAQDCRAFFRRQIIHRNNAYLRFDLVVHCAAVIGGRETIENDPLATAESLAIDAEMFRWAAAVRPGRVLYLSSSAAYPVVDQHGAYPVHRLHEDNVWGEGRPRAGSFWEIAEPDEVYGWSKVSGELLAERLRSAGVPVTVVRPFSGYGDDQDPSYPFRAILDRARALEPGQEMTVWSNAVRDFIHVDDVVAGALAVVESGTERPVNLCTGRAVSFTSLARMMLEALGKTTPFGLGVRVLTDKPAGVPYRVGDPDRMRACYTPQVTLEEGIRRAVDGV